MKILWNCGKNSLKICWWYFIIAVGHFKISDTHKSQNKLTERFKTFLVLLWRSPVSRCQINKSCAYFSERWLNTERQPYVQFGTTVMPVSELDSFFDMTEILHNNLRPKSLLKHWYCKHKATINLAVWYQVRYFSFDRIQWSIWLQIYLISCRVKFFERFQHQSVFRSTKAVLKTWRHCLAMTSNQWNVPLNFVMKIKMLSIESPEHK